MGLYEKVLFTITVPSVVQDLRNDFFIKEIVEQLDKLGIEHNVVDSIPGSFSLDQNWLQFQIEECDTQWNSVLPKKNQSKWIELLWYPVVNGSLVIRVHYWNNEKWNMHI